MTAVCVVSRQERCQQGVSYTLYRAVVGSNAGTPHMSGLAAAACTSCCAWSSDCVYVVCVLCVVAGLCESLLVQGVCCLQVLTGTLVSRAHVCWAAAQPPVWACCECVNAAPCCASTIIAAQHV